ncbi:MAG: choice-of-anchor tandem repeat GloVer-containing protein [Bacteroidia bacterium]
MKKILFLLSFVVITKTHAQYSKLFDFAGMTNGYAPYGSLISDGTFLYGLTTYGGTNAGTIFKIKPNGSGFVKLWDLGAGTDGQNPFGSLVSDGTFLYGTTMYGGTKDSGTVFKIKMDGTGYSKILDFGGAAKGSFPVGSLFFDGTFLYGMAGQGGANNQGVIFKLKPDGSNFSKLLDFSGTNGIDPQGSLISDGTYLYGMTQVGGINNKGTIFKILPNGTGYVKLLDFAGATNGSVPIGDLIFDGSFLYGMTYYGGTSDSGTVFKIKPDGTGYSKLLDFTGYANGGWPRGSLVYDGTFLYGMTLYGGANSVGVIFKIMPSGAGYVKLLDFNFTNGSAPDGSLFLSNGCLYGMTAGGGTQNDGLIFSLCGVTDVKNDVKNNEQLSIYPNPTNNQFILEATTSEQLKVDLYDINGRCVLSMAANNRSSIDVSSLSEGVYSVAIKTTDYTLNKKLVIVR